MFTISNLFHVSTWTDVIAAASDSCCILSHSICIIVDESKRFFSCTHDVPTLSITYRSILKRSLEHRFYTNQHASLPPLVPEFFIQSSLFAWGPWTNPSKNSYWFSSLIRLGLLIGNKVLKTCVLSSKSWSLFNLMFFCFFIYYLTSLIFCLMSKGLSSLIASSS